MTWLRISKTTEEFEEVFILYQLGVPYEEIAKRTMNKVATVKSMLNGRDIADPLPNTPSLRKESEEHRRVYLRRGPVFQQASEMNKQPHAFEPPTARGRLHATPRDVMSAVIAAPHLMSLLHLLAGEEEV